jgi:hypothetical protein
MAVHLQLSVIIFQYIMPAGFKDHVAQLLPDHSEGNQIDQPSFVSAHHTCRLALFESGLR